MTFDTIRADAQGAVASSREAERHLASASPGRKLRVVILDEELPYPLTSGKRLRAFNLLVRLATRHEITYIGHQNAEPLEAVRAAEALQDHGIRGIAVPRAVPRKAGLAFYGRLAANLFSPLPYSVASHRSRAMHRVVEAHAQTHEVDLWQAEWTPYTEVLPSVMHGRRLVVAHNVESVIWQRYFETEKNACKRWYIRHQWRKFRSFEKSAFGRVDRVVAVTSKDARRIADEFGCAHVSVVDNGVDLDYFRDTRGKADPHQILFLGSLDWRPNQDAIQLLLRHILPELRVREPRAHLAVVGRNPPSWLRQQLMHHTHVVLHENVPDVRPFLGTSAVMAVPLRIGGGSRLKILEALAAGLPVVSTSVGAEGLTLVPGRHLDIVESPASMASALVAVLHDLPRARQMAEHGRVEVLNQYDWNRLAAKLEQVWFDCLSSSHENLSSIAAPSRVAHA
jgi:glycosyltransferase involved in cell wall biosynthesis